MIDKLVGYLAEKEIVILGFGLEGQSTYRFLRRYLPDKTVTIADQQEDLLEKFDFLREDERVVVRGGADYLEGVADYDLVIKTPGISLLGVKLEGWAEKISSQMELFLEFFEGKTVGVTGTKGKSTTSSLIYQILQDQKVDSLLLGNIGMPVFDCLEEMTPETIVVLELSSHQLEYMRRSPKIAVLLNLYEEHLDHYGTFEKYVLAKRRILEYQTQDDNLLYNSDDAMVREEIKVGQAEKWSVSLTGQARVETEGDVVKIDGEEVYDRRRERNLLGAYNLQNIMFALGVAWILGLDMEQAAKSVDEFKTLAHRLDLVGEYGGVKYYDNSIATIPEATEAAVRALGGVDTLIIGGMDRGVDFMKFIEFLRGDEVKKVICMPETGYKIAEKLPEEKRLVVQDLAEAVQAAGKVTEKGGICLLSPAAASYGFFKNFAEKGDLFQKLVKEAE